MTLNDILRTAFEAGRAGTDWMTWTASDEVQAYVDGGLDFPDKDAERHYAAGRRERRLAEGWKVCWTTAPDSYDWFGTETLELVGLHFGKMVRKVMMHPDQARGQMDRYGSGICGVWDRDPIEERKEILERIERENQARKAFEERRVAERARIAAMTDEELSRADEIDEGFDYADIRAERDLRRLTREATERKVAWERDRATFADGACIVDDGMPARRDAIGVIPARPSRVWYSVVVEQRGVLSDDVAKAIVVGASNDPVGSLEYVAQGIRDGRYRVAHAAELPPRAALARIGFDRLKDILAVNAATGQRVWAGRREFDRDPMVVDEKGHLVRNRAVKEQALKAYWAVRGFG